MSVKQSVEWEFAGEIEVLGENLPSATFSTTNLTWTDMGSNPGRRGGKPATNRLSCCTVLWSILEQGRVVGSSERGNRTWVPIKDDVVLDQISRY
jgi:hypothetical protein